MLSITQTQEPRTTMPTRTITQAPEIELPPDAATADDHRNPRRRRRDRDEEEPPPDVGMLVQPEPRHDLDKMILHPEVKTDIHAGLRALEIRADLDRIWNLSSIQPQQGRCILNFYGPPGTGKTRAALGIALRLGKPLYQVDYSAVISRNWVKYLRAIDLSPLDFSKTVIIRLAVSHSSTGRRTSSAPKTSWADEPIETSFSNFNNSSPYRSTPRGSSARISSLDKAFSSLRTQLRSENHARKRNMKLLNAGLVCMRVGKDFSCIRLLEPSRPANPACVQNIGLH